MNDAVVAWLNDLSSGEAWKEFHTAMETWDEPRADRAITALSRSCGAQEVTLSN